MKLKQRIGDFRVRELMDEGYLVPRGPHRVYRVTKRKLTTPEAIDVLAAEAGVDKADVAVAGWKDRQSISIQYMSVPKGPKLMLQEAELKIDTVGFGAEAYSSERSRGNAFELNVRALRGEDLSLLRKNVPVVREHGVVDYFDDQRFGNLTHGQGWIVKELMLGRAEEALKALLTAPSPHDDEQRSRFKRAFARAWGDWRACRDVAGKFGKHHSIFEHLQKQPTDFAGAFAHVATRIRLIHLFAWQSHLWNRAVCALVRNETPLEERVLMDSEEGVLVAPAGAPSAILAGRAGFRLPGVRLEGVADPAELTLYEDALAAEGLVPDQLVVDDAPGFHLIGEDRPLFVRPSHLRVRPAEEDPMNRGLRMVRVRFELPRGSYASLVVKRLFAPSQAERERRRERAERRNRSRGAGGGRPDPRERGHGRERESAQGYEPRGGGRGARRDRERDPRRDEGGERTPPWKRRDEGGERGRPWKRRDEGGERTPPWKRRDEGEERGRPWKRRDEGGERTPPWKRRDEGGERTPTWKRRDEGGERGRPWKRRDEGGERTPPWKRRDEGEERGRPWKRRDEGGERTPPWKRRDEGGERARPWKRGEEGERGQSWRSRDEGARSGGRKRDDRGERRDRPLRDDRGERRSGGGRGREGEERGQRPVRGGWNRDEGRDARGRGADAGGDRRGRRDSGGRGRDDRRSGPGAPARGGGGQRRYPRRGEGR